MYPFRIQRTEVVPEVITGSHTRNQSSGQLTCHTVFYSVRHGQMEGRMEGRTGNVQFLVSPGSKQAFAKQYTLPTDQLFSLEFQFESVFKLEFQPKFGIQLGIPIPMGINLGECKGCNFLYCFKEKYVSFLF